LAARAVHSSQTIRREPLAMKASAFSPRRSVRPQTPQDTAARLVVIDFRSMLPLRVPAATAAPAAV
jgi:hypothetical protein